MQNCTSVQRNIIILKKKYRITVIAGNTGSPTTGVEAHVIVVCRTRFATIFYRYVRFSLFFFFPLPVCYYFILFFFSFLSPTRPKFRFCRRRRRGANDVSGVCLSPADKNNDFATGNNTIRVDKLLIRHCCNTDTRG